ncbi:hypothetical protein Adu01nite_78300 [Paractinoplanes durhamensis]|uniref:Uncharacterized protein n=1 Tax=Paractinoplanes durhamensis TaxID=113563 RepID=A0ABQ3Z9I9_9ACTN|nr:hypothetical protein Adu01nite_78300 [Actinoplanes durhamensis]
MQVGQLEDLAGEERATLALISGRPAGVPHVVRHDELGSALEDLEQRDWTIGTHENSGRPDLDHRQPPPGGRDGVTLSRVLLLSAPEIIELLLPGRAVDDRG